MLIEELIELANKICKQKAEEQTIELKSAQTGCPKRLYDTLSSFSNQDSGGILVFGIDEDAAFQVVGVYDPQDLQKKITEQCLQMEPPVRAVFTLAEYQGKTICAAEIPAIDIAERPCYYRGAGRTKGCNISTKQPVSTVAHGLLFIAAPVMSDAAAFLNSPAGRSVSRTPR